MFRVMPVSLEFLRGVLGMLSILFGFFAGRSAAAVRKGKEKLSRFYAWIIRAVACAMVLAIRHPIDVVVIGVWTLVLLAAAAGWWEASRARKVEDVRIFRE